MPSVTLVHDMTLYEMAYKFKQFTVLFDTSKDKMMPKSIGYGLGM